MKELRVLVVEADPVAQALVRSNLTAAGFDVEVVASGEAALAAVEKRKPDVALLDTDLPGKSGLEVLQRLREWTMVPVIMLTADARSETVTQALDLGADGYVTKPFEKGELIARIRAIVRRAAGSDAPKSLIAGILAIYPDERVILRGTEEIHLTATELRLLIVLVTRPGVVISCEELMRNVWGEGFHNVKKLQNYIFRLRKKIELDPHDPRCLVQRGCGYVFRETECGGDGKDER